MADINGSGLVEGSPEDDTIRGSPGPDRILAGGGADTIDGAGGPDSIEGGDGDDRVFLRGDARGVAYDGGAGTTPSYSRAWAQARIASNCRPGLSLKMESPLAR